MTLQRPDVLGLRLHKEWRSSQQIFTIASSSPSHVPAPLKKCCLLTSFPQDRPCSSGNVNARQERRQFSTFGSLDGQSYSLRYGHAATLCRLLRASQLAVTFASARVTSRALNSVTCIFYWLLHLPSSVEPRPVQAVAEPSSGRCGTHLVNPMLAVWNLSAILCNMSNTVRIVPDCVTTVPARTA